MYGLGMTSIATYLGGKHAAWGIDNSASAGAHIKFLLHGVQLFMTTLASNLQRLDHLDLTMPDLCVATETVHPMFGYMVVMHEFTIFITLHTFNMAAKTTLFRHIPFAGGHIKMTLIACYSDFQVRTVRESKAIVFHGFGWGTMTRWATRNRLASGCALKVAEKTDLFGN